MKKLKNLNIFIFLLIVISNTTVYADFQDDINKYGEHFKNSTALKRTTEIYKLKTELQRAKLECQKFGGCKSKTIYTPSTNNNVVNNEKTQKDKELVAVLNKPLPVITSIYGNSVSFNSDAKRYVVDDVVYGVWLIESIKLTQISVNNKDTGKSRILYFYWK